MLRIAIDPNVRVRGNGTYAGFEDVQGALTGLQVGDAVEVFERESDLTGEGRVTEIDLARRLVYVSVEWSTLRPRVEQPRFDNGGILPPGLGTVYNGTGRPEYLGRQDAGPLK